MSRRRRRVKIKSSSRLFAFILFNLLLLASCTTAHYLQDQPQPLESHSLADYNQANLHQQQHQQQAQSSQSATQGISMTTLANSNKNNQQARVSILSTSQPFSLIESQHETSFASQQAASQQAASNVVGAGSSSPEDQEETGETEEVNAQQEQVVVAHPHRQPGPGVNSAQDINNGQQHYSNGALPSVANLCSQLPTARHLKLCKLIGRSPYADETVAVGAARGLAECRNQFKSERWNCTHASGDHHLLTSRLAQSVGNRESAFVQAIAAAGIVHSIATACSIGSLSDCECDKTRVGLIRQKDQIWKWGGCSNNIRHGMVFAKHLVELLDAVHEHSRQQQQLAAHHHQHHLTKRQLTRRSLSSRHREPNQVQLGGGSSNQLDTATPLATPAELLQQQQQLLNFCQKNQNISQSTQIQLIKSLLAKNSLERHQDFRLAMNMHNNRVGRMAVAKNMEIKCRCHGLSGSCSLKTCWLRLPDFQQIGAYLKHKYDNSVHLPNAINLNRLIPMMDKQEISAILLQNNQEQEHQAVAQSNQVAPEFAALTSSAAVERPSPPTNQPNLTAAASPPTSATAGLHFSYYERHKQQLERLASAPAAASPARGTNSVSSSPLSSPANYMNQTSLFLHGDETPINIVPMSQQQYQSLLRDMKLCNSNASMSKAPSAHQYQIGPTTGHLLHKRHLMGMRSDSQQMARHQVNSNIHHQQHHHQQRLQHTAKRLHHQAAQSTASRHSVNQQRNHHNHHQPIGQLLGSQNRDDLVHLHKSPDYCEADLRHGFGGVQARACSLDPLASNSCDKLCCGRGHETRESQIRYKCDCKFQYCCTIHCNYCHKRVVEFVCR